MASVDFDSILGSPEMQTMVMASAMKECGTTTERVVTQSFWCALNSGLPLRHELLPRRQWYLFAIASRLLLAPRGVASLLTVSLEDKEDRDRRPSATDLLQQISIANSPLPPSVADEIFTFCAENISATPDMLDSTAWRVALLRVAAYLYTDNFPKQTGIAIQKLVEQYLLPYKQRSVCEAGLHWNSVRYTEELGTLAWCYQRALEKVVQVYQAQDTCGLDGTTFLRFMKAFGLSPQLISVNGVMRVVSDAGRVLKDRFDMLNALARVATDAPQTKPKLVTLMGKIDYFLHASFGPGFEASIGEPISKYLRSTPPDPVVTHTTPNTVPVSGGMVALHGSNLDELGVGLYATLTSTAFPEPTDFSTENLSDTGYLARLLVVPLQTGYTRVLVVRGALEHRIPVPSIPKGTALVESHIEIVEGATEPSGPISVKYSECLPFTLTVFNSAEALLENSGGASVTVRYSSSDPCSVLPADLARFLRRLHAAASDVGTGMVSSNSWRLLRQKFNIPECGGRPLSAATKDITSDVEANTLTFPRFIKVLCLTVLEEHKSIADLSSVITRWFVPCATPDQKMFDDALALFHAARRRSDAGIETKLTPFWFRSEGKQQSPSLSPRQSVARLRDDDAAPQGSSRHLLSDLLMSKLRRASSVLSHLREEFEKEETTPTPSRMPSMFRKSFRGFGGEGDGPPQSIAKKGVSWAQPSQQFDEVTELLEAVFEEVADLTSGGTDLHNKVAQSREQASRAVRESRLKGEAIARLRQQQGIQLESMKKTVHDLKDKLSTRDEVIRIYEEFARGLARSMQEMEQLCRLCANQTAKISISAHQVAGDVPIEEIPDKIREMARTYVKNIEKISGSCQERVREVVRLCTMSLQGDKGALNRADEQAVGEVSLDSEEVVMELDEYTTHILNRIREEKDRLLREGIGVRAEALFQQKEARLQADMKLKVEEMNRVHEASETAHREAIAKREATIAEQQAELDEARKTVDRLNKRMQTLERQAETRTRILLERRPDTEETEDAGPSSVARLRQEIRLLTAELADKDKALEDLRGEMDEVRDELFAKEKLQKHTSNRLTSLLMAQEGSDQASEGDDKSKKATLDAAPITVEKAKRKLRRKKSSRADEGVSDAESRTADPQVMQLRVELDHCLKENEIMRRLLALKKHEIPKPDAHETEAASRQANPSQEKRVRLAEPPQNSTPPPSSLDSAPHPEQSMVGRSDAPVESIHSIVLSPPPDSYTGSFSLPQILAAPLPTNPTATQKEIFRLQQELEHMGHRARRQSESLYSNMLHMEKDLQQYRRMVPQLSQELDMVRHQLAMAERQLEEEANARAPREVRERAAPRRKTKDATVQTDLKEEQAAVPVSPEYRRHSLTDAELVAEHIIGEEITAFRRVDVNKMQPAIVKHINKLRSMGRVLDSRRWAWALSILTGTESMVQTPKRKSLSGQSVDLETPRSDSEPGSPGAKGETLKAKHKGKAGHHESHTFLSTINIQETVAVEMSLGGQDNLGVQWVGSSEGNFAIAQVVPGGPADRAALVPGMKLLAAGGKMVAGASGLSRALQALRSGPSMWILSKPEEEIKTPTPVLKSLSPVVRPESPPKDDDEGVPCPMCGAPGYHREASDFVEDEQVESRGEDDTQQARSPRSRSRYQLRHLRELLEGTRSVVLRYLHQFQESLIKLIEGLAVLVVKAEHNEAPVITDTESAALDRIKQPQTTVPHEETSADCGFAKLSGTLLYYKAREVIAKEAALLDDASEKDTRLKKEILLSRFRCIASRIRLQNAKKSQSLRMMHLATQQATLEHKRDILLQERKDNAERLRVLLRSHSAATNLMVPGRTRRSVQFQGQLSESRGSFSEAGQVVANLLGMQDWVSPALMQRKVGLLQHELESCKKQVMHLTSELYRRHIEENFLQVAGKKETSRKALSWMNADLVATLRSMGHGAQMIRDFEREAKGNLDHVLVQGISCKVGKDELQRPSTTPGSPRDWSVAAQMFRSNRVPQPPGPARVVRKRLVLPDDSTDSPPGPADVSPVDSSHTSPLDSQGALIPICVVDGESLGMPQEVIPLPPATSSMFDVSSSSTLGNLLSDTFRRRAPQSRKAPLRPSPPPPSTHRKPPLSLAAVTGGKGRSSEPSSAPQAYQMLRLVPKAVQTKTKPVTAQKVGKINKLIREEAANNGAFEGIAPAT